MSTRSRFAQFRQINGRLPLWTLAFSSTITLVAMLAFGPVVPRPVLWQIMAVPLVSPAESGPDSPWAGHLESPAAQDTKAPTKPLTSASYTSGFDKAAAGLAPEPPSPPAKLQASDERACPDGLNCSFRKVTMLPPRPPAESMAVASAAPIAQSTRHPFSLAAFTPHFPPPNTLLKPFTFVADTFTGLIKKL
jgi:hypothetical protein